MTKKQKEQLLEKLIADVKRENHNVYYAEINERRMAAAQRGMYALGQIIGLVGGDLLDYRVEAQSPNSSSSSAIGLSARGVGSSQSAMSGARSLPRRIAPRRRRND